jgi:hypothetical protein
VKRNLHALSNGELSSFGMMTIGTAHPGLYQVEPLLKGEADLSAFGRSIIYSLEDHKFWSYGAPSKEYVCFGVHCGRLHFGGEFGRWISISG